MDNTWSNFLFQATPSQAQTDSGVQSELGSADGSVQAELLPELAGDTHSPAHEEAPPSTIDAAALKEDTQTHAAPPAPPVKGVHTCATCGRQFKSGYNLRRHQSVHTGVKMKGAKGGAKTTVPLSLLHLTNPLLDTTPAVTTSANQALAALPVTTGNQSIAALPVTSGNQAFAALPVTTGNQSIATIAGQPISTAVMVGGTTVQVLATPLTLVPSGMSVCADASVCTNASVCAGAGTAVPVSVCAGVPTSVSVCGDASAAACVSVCAGAAVPASAPASGSASTVRKNHVCEACGKAFRDVYHLNRHRLSHSDEKPFTCPICQQRFKRKDRMSHHVRSHQGGVEKPYVCPHCSKAFSRPDHLNSHVRQVHSTERPFKCPTCTSAFATKDRLRAHLIRHEDKVPCHVCGKLLSPAYITDHMRVHNQSQHHLCHLCSRSFTSLTYLRVHAQKQHGGAWRECVGGRGVGGVLLCHLCGVHCKTPTQLQGHMSTHQPITAQIQDHVTAGEPITAQIQGHVTATGEPITIQLQSHVATHDPAHPTKDTPITVQLQGQVIAHDPSQPTAQLQAHMTTQEPAHSTKDAPMAGQEAASSTVDGSDPVQDAQDPASSTQASAQIQGHVTGHEPITAQILGHMATQAVAHSTQATPSTATITVTDGNHTVSLLLTDCTPITPQS
ncbi:myc-associated zinc finger protein-like isoform X2 [Engraulis encrasicolus]|uniref:myc-associated zinc finger protein-like isoform X2 n=1 Tax=Engraulis encrasicolus TaxID=184585 RepID=UPI002FD762D6